MTHQLSINVNPAQVSVDPGGQAEVVLRLENRADVIDELVVEVLGDAAAWTSIDRSRVPIFPGATESVRVTLQPPRAPNPEAGTIPVGFQVRSTVDPIASLVEECQVVLKPFTEIGGEIAPKTARGRFSATHRLRLINQGNAPVSVTVRAEMQQGDCEISVPADPLQLAAGEQKVTRIKVRPSSAHWQGGDEMHQYTLNLQPHGGGTPVALNAMMRQRPIARIPTALLLAAALLLGGAYVAYGKGPNPLQNVRPSWMGSVDVGPDASSPSPRPTSGPTPSVQGSFPPPTGSPSQIVCQRIAPGAPSGVTAVPGDTSATVSWRAATSSCGLPITSYTVNASPGNISVAVGGGVTTATLSNLVNGTTYSATVVAANSVGSGPASSPPVTFSPVCPTTASPFSSLHLSRNSAFLLTWTSVGGCTPASGTITARYGIYNPPGDCFVGRVCPSYIYVTSTYSVTGLKGSFQDPKGGTYDSYFYTLKLTDGRQTTLTATTS